MGIGGVRRLQRSTLDLDQKLPLNPQVKRPVFLHRLELGQCVKHFTLVSYTAYLNSMTLLSCCI